MLTDEDREAIAHADESCGCNGVGEHMYSAVEAIVARHVKAALNEAANNVHIQRFAKEEGTLRGPDSYYNGAITAVRIVCAAADTT